MPSLVVTLLVGTSPPEDFDSVPLVLGGVSVVREALGLLLEDMGTCGIKIKRKPIGRCTTGRNPHPLERYGH